MRPRPLRDQTFTAPPEAIGADAGQRRRSPARQFLLIVLLAMPVGLLLLGAWIGLAIVLNRDPAHPVSAEAALNLLIVGMVAIVGLPLMHYGQYRQYRGRPIGAPQAHAAPSAAVRWPAAIRLRHAVLYAIAIPLLLLTFAPYGHQRALWTFVDRHSAGSASGASLAALLFDYVPLALLCIGAAWLADRARRRRNAGLSDADQARLAAAETDWLFSFVTALVIAAFLCRFAGALIIGYLT